MAAMMVVAVATSSCFFVVVRADGVVVEQRQCVQLVKVAHVFLEKTVILRWLFLLTAASYHPEGLSSHVYGRGITQSNHHVLSTAFRALVQRTITAGVSAGLNVKNASPKGFYTACGSRYRAGLRYDFARR